MFWIGAGVGAVVAVAAVFVWAAVAVAKLSDEATEAQCGKGDSC